MDRYAPESIKVTPEEFKAALDKMNEEWPEAVKLANKRFDWVVSFMAMTDRFNFEILGRMLRFPTLKIDTAAVGPYGVQVALFYNPFFIDRLSDEELRWVLTHEVAHVVLHHITTRASNIKKEAHSQNVAADLAINSLFGDYAGTAYPRAKQDRVGVKSGKVHVKAGEPWVLRPSQYKFPEHLSMEQYHQLWKVAVEKGEIDLEDYASGEDGQFDWHMGWGENPAISEQIREWVQQISKSNAWGSLSGNAIEAIKAAQLTEVPWYKILRHYYGLISSKEKVSTYKRPSRRMWYPWVGKRFEGMDRKLVAVDTSGSVPDQALARFVAETNALAKDFPVDLVCWDTEVKNPKPVRWNLKKRSFNFQGRGGTDPQPVLDFAKAHHYRSIIMLTDGWFSTPKLPPHLDVLWVITPGGDVNHLGGGRCVQMKMPLGQ